MAASIQSGIRARQQTSTFRVQAVDVIYNCCPIKCLQFCTVKHETPPCPSPYCKAQEERYRVKVIIEGSTVVDLTGYQVVNGKLRKING